MQTLLKKHSLLISFLLILCLLAYGMVLTSGTTHLPNFLFFTASLGVSYTILSYLFRKKQESKINITLPEKWIMPSYNGVIVFLILFQILHYISIGNVPIIKAMMTTDYYYIAQIRQDIKLADGVFIRYFSAFFIKAIIPFFLVLFYLRDKKRFWIFFLFSAFYALALMQKAFIVTLMIPLVCRLLLDRKWIMSIVFMAASVAGVSFLIVVTNPNLRAGAKEEKAVQETTGGAAGVVSDAIYGRVFVTTGRMVGNWFACVPDSLPYLYGAGYRFLEPITGMKYRDYSKEIYPMLYAKEAGMGFEGTATTAFFMYDYVNFGKYGLVLAGIYISLFFIMIHSFFGTDTKSLVTFNFLFIFWLSSASFTSTLLSGGWIPTIILYFLFKKQFLLPKKKSA